LTVEEAARVLRIGRTAAYLAAKRYRETDGAEGLPCIAIRGSLRVPRRHLEAMAGGPIETGGPAETRKAGRHRGPTRSDPITHQPSSSTEQHRLPFTS
jgi:hypothetical protein